MGGVREIRAQLGQTLMEAAVDTDIPGITADCGGSCACATCHVVVADRWLDVVGTPSAARKSVVQGESLSVRVDHGHRRINKNITARLETVVRNCNIQKKQ